MPRTKDTCKLLILHFMILSLLFKLTGANKKHNDTLDSLVTIKVLLHENENCYDLGA